MLGKLLNLIALFIGFLWTAVLAVICLSICMFDQDRGLAVQRAWARGVLKILGIRAYAFELENLPAGACILTPNHESWFDIILMAALPRDFRWVSKVEVARVPFVGWALRAMGAYLVRRNRSSHDLNVMKEVEEGLRSGNSVLIFPEGTRTRTGDLLPFKKGAFRAAQHTSVPLCPIAIRGARQIGQHGKLPSKRGHRVELRIGLPFHVGPDERIEDASAKFRETLTKLLSQAGGKGVEL